jgi:hypothetical protein
MCCPNCGQVGCHCTWEDITYAMRIIRRQEAEHRRNIGKPTVVERERERQRQRQNETLAPHSS